jgi:hypothetical protein
VNSAIDEPRDQMMRRANGFAGRRLRRFIGVVLIAVYCLARFFALDFLYSRLFFNHTHEIPGISNPVFHHTLRPISTGGSCGVIFTTA